MKFTEMKLSEKTLKGLEKMGFETATEIQQRAIPAGLAGKDILGQAQTGTGKTAAFGLCILEKTNWDEQNAGIQHLILTPTRELAMQIANEITQIGRFYHLRIGVIIGGESYRMQEQMLRSMPQIIVSTPGRLIDYIEKGKIQFSNLKTFTLDEVDEMLNVGFYTEVLKIVAKIPKQISKYMFTATTDKRTERIANELLVNPEIIKVSSGHESKKNIKQMAIIVKEHEKFEALVNQIMHHSAKQAIIFCRTKIRVKKLCLDLRQLGIRAEMIQGDMSQQARSRALENFKDNKDQILIATDVAARGIDVPGIEYVYNYDLPENDEYYVHRIGRTGRAGKEGNSYSFVKPSELQDLERLSKLTKSTIEKVQMPKSQINVGHKLALDAIKSKIESVAYLNDSVSKDLVDEILKTTTHEQLVKTLISLSKPRVNEERSYDKPQGFRRFDRQSDRPNFSRSNERSGERKSFRPWNKEGNRDEKRHGFNRDRQEYKPRFEKRSDGERSSSFKKPFHGDKKWK